MKLGIRITNLLTATGFLACMVTLVGFLGPFWWGFELATHFRVQYALALGGFALIPLARRQWRWSALFGAFALLNLAFILPAFQLSALQAEAPTTPVTATGNLPTLRALLANVNADNRDAERLRRLIAASDPDMILLLEATPWLLDQLRDLGRRYPHHLTEPREDPFGIALFSRHPFVQSQIVHFGDAISPPAVMVTINAGEHPFALIGVHPWPPVSADLAEGRNAQLRALATRVRQCQIPVLVLGDLNLSPWSPWFARLLADTGLRDSRRGRGLQPSWPAGWWPLWIPIDHALFSAGIRIQHREIGPAIGSDHYPVIVDFQVSGP
ncbi:MAG: endonuclease/exonuclease/phosphatase family protein [Candidatus Contendobacter sp.]|nr:endonuclease/exonuclease/phosphatase family protein [Candidatus Contendobacter sp.]